MCGLPIKCEHFNTYAFTLPLAQMSKKKKKDGNVSKKWTCRFPCRLLKIQSLTQTVAFFLMCGIFFPCHDSVVCVNVCVYTRVCICACVCMCSVPTRICLGAHYIFFCAMELFTLSMTEQDTVTSSLSCLLCSALRKSKIKAPLTIKMINSTYVVPNARM